MPALLRGPVLLPPCIRQRLFAIAGARQAVPMRVFAPHLSHFAKFGTLPAKPLHGVSREKLISSP